MRLALLLSLLLLCGCAAPSITLESLEPAANPEVARMRKLAVGSLRGDRSGAAASAVESALSEITLGEKPYFTIVDGRGVAEGDDVTAARKAGRLSGADGVVLGSVAASDWRDAPTTQSRSVCVAWRENGSCRRMASVPVRCVVRTATFRFTPRVVDARTGVVALSEEIAESRESRACPGFEGERLAPGEGLVADARRAAVQRLRNLMAPHFVRRNIALLLDDGSAIPEGVKKRIAEGADFAAAGDMKRACAQWMAASGAHGAGYALPYLNGVCAEYAGDLEQALRYYNQAARAAVKPVWEINEAMERVRKARSDELLLHEQTR